MLSTTMLSTINTKLLILIAALLAAIASDLTYVAYQARVSASASAAMEKRQAEAENARRKMQDDFRKAARGQPSTWGGAAQSIQNWRLETRSGRHADGKGGNK